MPRLSRLPAWIYPISPRTWAMMLYVLVLLGYTFTTPLSWIRLFSVVGVLLILLLLMPFLLANQPHYVELRAAAVVLLPALVIIISHATPSLLWLVLLVSTLALPKIIPLKSAWIILGAVWSGWLFSSVALGLLLKPYEVAVVIAAMIAIMAWVSLRRVTHAPEPILDHLPIQRVTRASERLRGTTNTQDILEELASAAKASGSFSSASVATVDLKADVMQMVVALGASGRTLGATESLRIAWSEFVPVLRTDQQISDHSFYAQELPFRQIGAEEHILVPLHTSKGEISGLLIVSDSGEQAKQRLINFAPLLELLAAQASLALESAALQTTLAQRVEATTAEIGRNAEDAQRARSRAENMYHIVRTLSTTLEPQPLLDQALLLLAQTTQAERGGIMMIEPRSGRLIFGSNLDQSILRDDAIALERGQGLAGWVVEHQQSVIIPNTAEDSRWVRRSEYDNQGRSVIAVPMMQDNTVAGVIVLIKNSLDHFTQEHEQFIQVIGDQVAAMLTNVSQYQQAIVQASTMSQTLVQREEEVSRSLAIVRSIGDGVVVGDRVGRIRLINPAAESLLNIKAPEFLGKSLASLPGAPEQYHEYTQNHNHQEFEVNGRIIRAFSTPVFTNRNEWMGSVIVYHDITAVQLADRLKTEFVATASHELRTPLTSIRGYIDLLMLDSLGPVNAQQRQFLEVVRTNIERLNAILNDLLDVSRIEAGQIRLQRGEVNLQEVLQHAMTAVHQQYPHKNISLALDVPADFPTITADEERLHQVMVHLISNAYKYTPDGGRVDIVARNGGDGVTIAVKDTGVGINESDRELMFTRFFRSENPLKEQAGGAGLGLSIAKSLVELHGGRIWFDSVEGKGSTFTVQLPVGSEADWTPAAWLEGV